MKNLSTKTFIFIAVYAVLCFIICMIFSLTATRIPPLLAFDTFSYKFFSGLTLFFEWFASIVLSVAFISFASFFDSLHIKNTQRFSSAQMENYKKMILITIGCVFAVFCVTEIFLPMSVNAQNDRINRYADYNWYIDQSKVAFTDENISGALLYVETALELYPDSQEAADLKESFERAPAETVAIEVLNNSNPDTGTPQTGLFSDSATVFALLEQARTAFAEKNYFDAHYYAFTALRFGGRNDANATELQKIAQESWDILSHWSGFESDEQARIFDLKRQGYAALVRGDVLTAYYIYLDLYNANHFDPDISRYYNLSIEALLNEHFFIDETHNLAFFESGHDIEFSVANPAGGMFEISIVGITTIQNTGNYLKYLRGYSCTAYDDFGNIIYSYTVPYVKLVGEPAANFDMQTISALEITNTETPIPHLLLTSVDRNTQGIVSAPVYTHGEEYASDKLVEFLPMTLDDFNLVVEASAGPTYMNLASLFTFLPKADLYNFSSQLYGAVFLKRACYPFLLFVIFIFLAIQAWNFRLGESVIFRFYWVLIVPLFTIFAQIAGAFVDYGMNLVYFTVATMKGFSQITIALIIFFVMLIILSVRFLSLHNEEKTD